MIMNHSYYKIYDINELKAWTIVITRKQKFNIFVKNN